jgi:DNA-binding NtrC family response regulator
VSGRGSGAKPDPAWPYPRRVREFIRKAAAAVHLSVLLEGETGTGKSYVARAIHDQSPRAREPFISANAPSFAPTLIQSELYGHEKGAFTDAREARVGLIELARGGTLFLDEIGDLPPPIQMHLLTVLEDRVFRRLGGTREIVTEARFTFATNRPMDELLRTGGFRSDLFYRVAQLRITLPPLRERLQDLEAIARCILVREMAAGAETGPVPALAPDLLEALRAYSWPGNVREYRNVLLNIWVESEGAPVLLLDHLPSHLLRGAPPAGGPITKQRRSRYVPSEDPVAERQMIVDALRLHRGHRTKAARHLGMGRQTLWVRVTLYHIEPSEWGVAS